MSGILFFKYYFGHTTFLYSFKSTSGHHQSFFNFRSSSRKSQGRKDHAFYSTVLLKKTSLILRTSTRLALGITQTKTFLLRCQKTTATTTKKTKNKTKKKHLHCTIFWRPRAAFLSAYFCISLCLYVSVRKFLFQTRSKILLGRDGLGWDWIIYWRRLAIWAL